MDRTGLAVVFIIYNRAAATEQSFAAIRAARPAQLIIVADGPRRDIAADDDACAATRAVVDRIDWHCDVQHNYADINLGCRTRVSSGLNWAFDITDRAVILEDDCVAGADFFRFTSSLLHRYADDERVWHISGGQYWAARPRTERSYYFSKYPHIWGWATWARAWRHYDDAMTFWPGLRASARWPQLMPLPAERRHWTHVLDRAHARRVDSWAYPWIGCVWHHGGLTATPYVNLVKNIGLGADATHTTHADPSLAPPRASLGELHHPAVVQHDADGDNGEFHESTWGRELRHRRSPAGLVRRAVDRLERLRRPH